MPEFTAAEIGKLMRLLQLGGDNSVPGSWLLDASVQAAKLAGSIPGDKIVSLPAWKVTGVLPSDQITELDPLFSASVAALISSADVTNWNAAFAWGNHAGAGYLTSAPFLRVNELDAAGGETTITLSATPFAGSNVQVFKNRSLLREGITHDFTVAGVTVTLGVAAAPGDEYLVYYTA